MLRRPFFSRILLVNMLFITFAQSFAQPALVEPSIDKLCADLNTIELEVRSGKSPVEIRNIIIGLNNYWQNASDQAKLACSDYNAGVVCQKDSIEWQNREAFPSVSHYVNLLSFFLRNKELQEIRSGYPNFKLQNAEPFVPLCPNFNIQFN